MATTTWQTDPQLQQLLTRVRQLGLSDQSAAQALAAGRTSGSGSSARAQLDALTALAQYINQHGAQIGIPDGYTVSLDTGQLTKEAGIPWGKIALASGALLGGAIAAPAIMGAGASGTQAAGTAAGTGTTAAADGLIPATFATPAEIAGITVPTATQGTASALGGVGVGTTGATANSGNSLSGALKDFLTNPSNIATLAATIPTLAGAGSNSKSALDDPTVQQLLQMSLNRQQRTDPLHESITNLSMAMLPTAYQKR